MSKRNKVNKDFDVQCALGNNNPLKTRDGKYLCATKTSQNSKKVEMKPCNPECPNYRLIKHEKIGDKEQKIRKYILNDKSHNWKNAPCSKAQYYRVKNRLEEEDILNKVQGDLEEEKELIIVKEQTKSKPVRLPARNIETPYEQKLKPSLIKLCLNKFTQNKDALKHALDNRYRWIEYNLHEIEDYLKEYEEKHNRLPDWAENAKTTDGRYPHPNSYIKTLSKRELCECVGIPYYYPDWLKYFYKLIELSKAQNSSELRKRNLTTEEWYKEMEIEFPKLLEEEADLIITNKRDLDRTGIFVDLDLKIKESLDITDDMETAYMNWDELDSWEKTSIKAKMKTIQELKNHPYYILLKEKIEKE